VYIYIQTHSKCSPQRGAPVSVCRVLSIVFKAPVSVFKIPVSIFKAPVSVGGPG